MIVRTFTHSAEIGWSRSPLPDLDSASTLVLVFGDAIVTDSLDALATLNAHYPNSVVIGCSTAGEIFGDEIHDHSLAVAVAKFDKTRLCAETFQVSSPQESVSIGRKIARRLADVELKAIFVLSDGLQVNGSALTQGLAAELEPHVVVTGGLAADADRFEGTWVLHEGKPTSGLITAVGFYGEALQVGHGSGGGWDIFGPDRLVTRSKANVLLELDGKPALALYKSYLGELADQLPSSGLLFPLAIRTPLGQDDVVRTILAVDASEQSLTFAGDIPEGATVRLMHANMDRLIEGASSAAEGTDMHLGDDQDLLAVAISCVGRRLVLKDRCEEEVEAVLEVFPPNIHLIGYYSYGEISPLATGRCDLHNQTMTLTLFSEPETPQPGTEQSQHDAR